MDLEQANGPSEKRHCCTHPGCTKSFSTSAHLTRHAINHTGVRKYKCTWPSCTSSFYRADGLSQHIKVHKKQQEQQEQTSRIQCSIPYPAFHQVAQIPPTRPLPVHRKFYVPAISPQMPHRIPSSPHTYLASPRQSPLQVPRYSPMSHHHIARLPVIRQDILHSTPQRPPTPPENRYNATAKDWSSGSQLPPIRNSYATLLDAAQAVDVPASLKTSVSFLLE
ncbi:hypothetical protein BC830DRAFT_1090349 [Chytriomyces sp. MP71]|nr:hypothetical protein BC830DRAFT_1090349 [Chytriomyces sp. MP71]